eukprot:4511181-Pyramimonas_sp.AAC.1
MSPKAAVRSDIQLAVRTGVFCHHLPRAQLKGCAAPECLSAWGGVPPSIPGPSRLDLALISTRARRASPDEPAGAASST